MSRLRLGPVLQVAATYVGTVVGAGFASGQEILRFFAPFGRQGVLGVALAAALLSGYGILVMEMGRRTGARSHQEVLAAVCGRRLTPLVDVVLTALLLACLGIMVAAGGAIAAQQWGLPHGLGALAMAVLTAATVLGDLDGLVAANGTVVPVLVLAVGGLTGATLLSRGLPAPAGFPPGLSIGAPHWLVAAALYAGYNLVLSISVLAPLGAEVRDSRVLALGSLLGGAVLGLLGAGILLALNTSPEAGRHEVPMLHLARTHPAPVAPVYTLVLWAEVYTTAVACAFGASRRLQELVGGCSPGAGKIRLITLGALLLALAMSRLGFSRLVDRLYPVFGALSLVLLLLLLLRARRVLGSR